MTGRRQITAGIAEVISDWPVWSDERTVSEHLDLELAYAFTNGPLPQNAPVPGCGCGRCRLAEEAPVFECWAVVQ